MTSTRPKRASEAYARLHHGDAPEEKGKAHFDLRNPSILAPAGATAADDDEDEDASDEEEDAFLAADVIRGSASTKRGAVQIDGYDSDSDHDNINARAKLRKKRDVHLEDEFDQYQAGGRKTENDGDEDDDFDMFWGGEEKEKDEEEDEQDTKKQVRFVQARDLLGGKDSLDTGEPVEDAGPATQAVGKNGAKLSRQDEDEEEEDVDKEEEEEDEEEEEEEEEDPEVGAGGRKRNAPKLEGFNLRQEEEEGRFDETGNYVRRAVDPDAVHDRWLDGVSKKEMRRAAEAHRQREEERARQQQREDSVVTHELLATLLRHLEAGETPLEALARLGRQLPRKDKTVPSWKRKMLMERAPERPARTGPDTTVGQEGHVKEAIDEVTDAANKLLAQGETEIYDCERERMARLYRRETGRDWTMPTETKSVPVPVRTLHAETPPPRPLDPMDASATGAVPQTAKAAPGSMWEFQWRAHAPEKTDDDKTGEVHGPYDASLMQAWQTAGYFARSPVSFRPVGGEWVAHVDFALDS